MKKLFVCLLLCSCAFAGCGKDDFYETGFEGFEESTEFVSDTEVVQEVVIDTEEGHGEYSDDSKLVATGSVPWTIDNPVVGENSIPMGVPLSDIESAGWKLTKDYEDKKDTSVEPSGINSFSITDGKNVLTVGSVNSDIENDAEFSKCTVYAIGVRDIDCPTFSISGVGFEDTLETVQSKFGEPYYRYVEPDNSTTIKYATDKLTRIIQFYFEPDGKLLSIMIVGPY